MASSQPPEYHAQSTPFAVRRSPMVGFVSDGRRSAAAVVLGCGAFTVYVVFTTNPPGVRSPSFARRPSDSTLATRAFGASDDAGVQTQASHMSMTNEPPTAAWKKWSVSVYCAASCP